ncbi:MAG: tetratricopeptide repeat protein [Prochloraceae cyanobacterium]
MTKIKTAIAGVVTTLLSISAPLMSSAQPIGSYEEFYISCNEGAYYYKIQSRNCDGFISARTIELENLTGRIDANSNDATAYNRRGFARQRMGDFWGAIEDYSAAIELDSNNAMAYGKRGLAYQSLNYPWLAIEDYSAAIAIDAEFAEVHNNLGDSRIYLGDYNTGCANYLAATNLALENQDSDTYISAWRNLRLYCRGVLERFPR